MNIPVVFEKTNMVVVTPPHGEKDALFVDNIGWHKTPIGHSYGPAIRPYYLLHLVTSGKGEVERDGIVTCLGAGDAFLIRPNEITTYRSNSEQPWEYYWIAFYGDFAQTLLSYTQSDLFPSYRQSGLLALKAAVDRRETDCLELLNTLLTVLQSIQAPRVALRTQTDAITNAIAYIERNYFQEIDVTSLSQSFGYSRAHFSSQFSKRTGMGPHEYLTSVRIQNAKTLLQTTALTVEEIAYSVGFSSTQQLYAHFKKLTGTVPLAFRK